VYALDRQAIVTTIRGFRPMIGNHALSKLADGVLRRVAGSLPRLGRTSTDAFHPSSPLYLAGCRLPAVSRPVTGTTPDAQDHSTLPRPSRCSAFCSFSRRGFPQE